MTAQLASSTNETSTRQPWLILSVTLVGSAMSLLNSTIVNVALPSIRTSLAASDSALAWVVSGWALAFGLSLIPAGRLGDRIGHKWIFFVGVLLFTASSIASGFAQNETQLIIFRVVQGLAGGLFFSTTTVYIQLLFSGRAKGTAFGIMGAVIGVASAVGPLVGGLLIQAAGGADGWRLVFFINAPLGLIALIGTLLFVPNDVGDRATGEGLDLFGLTLLSVGLVAILVPLIEGQFEGWPTWTWASAVAGVIVLVLFVIWEQRVDVRGKLALVPPRLFRHPAFSAGSVLALLFFAAFVSIFYVLALLWQAGLGFTAFDTGLLSVPFAVGSIAGSAASGRLAHSLGRGVLLVGTAAVTVGLGWISVDLLVQHAENINAWALAAPLLLAGIGSGMFIAPNSQFIVATVKPSETGAASAVTATMQRLGTALGLALVASVFYGILPRSSTPSQSDYASSASISIGVCAALAAVSFALVFALPKHTAREQA
ncbi:MFS transporter [Paenarthrobacter nitroguajacolicus]|uniref:MFS transporter n=1 Tax=Paenarthrobacter nitroguajacolicus TaxID=211146 RepID=UPI0015C0C270|nr:MFS transporter [Paenarthrobacter nitroguajacolicus]NWL10428.1 MFS transporter [Paenarthrobacter nitroguajacolicus]